MTTLERFAPVFSVSNLRAALGRYERLGFSVARGTDGYGFASRDAVQLHMSVIPNVDPRVTGGCAYLYVDDADALAREWKDADVPGKVREPVDTPYGLREGAHLDPDGNLIRFGSRLT